MPRRLKVSTHEMGLLDLYLIYEHDGVWEDEWRLLQGEPVTDLITVVSKGTMDHCLLGWTSPFVKALGLPPWGVLRKLPLDALRCAQQSHCPFFDERNCTPTAKQMPWCFEPATSAGEEVRRLTSDLLLLWRQGVYVVLVREDPGCRI